MTGKDGRGYVTRFDHDLGRMVDAPIVSEVAARRSPVLNRVEVRMEGGGARDFKWISPGEARTLAAQLLAAADELDGGDDRWRHAKRGTVYQVKLRGELQTSRAIVEGETLVGYVGEDGRGWFRPAAEFDDGRFVPA